VPGDLFGAFERRESGDPKENRMALPTQASVYTGFFGSGTMWRRVTAALPPPVARCKYRGKRPPLYFGGDGGVPVLDRLRRPLPGQRAEYLAGFGRREQRRRLEQPPSTPFPSVYRNCPGGVPLKGKEARIFFF